jgi:hypothetical protein
MTFRINAASRDPHFFMPRFHFVAYRRKLTGPAASRMMIGDEKDESPREPLATIVNDNEKWSLRGAKRRGNLMGLLHCVRNGIADAHLFKSFKINWR